MIRSQIIATGSYLPNKVVSNFDLSKIVDTSDEWIIERTGIKNRHIAEDDQLTSDLALNACLKALKNAQIKAQDIEMIVLASTTPDLTFPATATILQKKLNANNAFAFDVQAVCSGFIYALNIADNFIRSGQVKNALVVGAETLSRIVDWKDRNTCILFGDGAGAVILQASTHKDSGIIASKLSSDGSLNDILKTSDGVSFSKKSGFIQMQGKEVFKHAVEKMVNCVNETLNLANLTISDIDYLVPHQANLRILKSVSQKLKLTDDQVIITLANQGNTSAASIPLALDFANQNNKFKKNDLLVLEALGGGLTWGSIIVRWC
ncbi:3-oxoacyl-[acyl-carrier-protein] synthase 3 [Alphaproteobacteria bacterium]|nr:3-oxoacyl-[acyl-carrier-protein] synthase 3 [Alphaproteobacteria bacterium]